MAQRETFKSLGATVVLSTILEPVVFTTWHIYVAVFLHLGYIFIESYKSLSQIDLNEKYFKFQNIAVTLLMPTLVDASNVLWLKYSEINSESTKWMLSICGDTCRFGRV